MASNSAVWRHGLGAAMRFANVQKIQRSIATAGTYSKTESQNEAFAAETKFYNESSSREDYDSACAVASSLGTELPLLSIPKISEPSNMTIGPYKNCTHIASGVVSEVYRSDVVALKVITETRDVEPHSPAREVKILRLLSHPNVIELLETANDAERRLILVFPYFPLTLANVLEKKGRFESSSLSTIFTSLFSALFYLHGQGIIHRDIKPSNMLLSSPSSPIKLADFGTAWHPTLSLSSEPANHKVLEVGTTCYRAPETLFGNRSYDTSLDMWSAGCVLAECLRIPPEPLFESRSGEEDGNQLGLILSIFKTIGTPTKETWPEAVDFSTPPFEWYQEFPGRTWEELLPSDYEEYRDLVMALVVYESKNRMTAEAALAKIRAA